MITFEEVNKVLRYDEASGKLYWKIRTSNRINIGDEAGRLNSSGYAVIGLRTKTYYAHRLAWFLSTGNWPENQIDHINGERADNRFVNLRQATNKDNCQNKRSAIGVDKENRLLGAYFHRPSGKFLAMIGVDGKSKYLGYFDTKEQEHQAYLSVKRKLHSFCQI